MSESSATVKPTLLNLVSLTDAGPSTNGRTKELKDMTISDILQIIQSQDQQNGVSKDAPLDEKVSYLMRELETIKRQVNQSKEKYRASIESLERVTKELHDNTQLLMQSKYEIQETKIESQRARIELNSLKQKTVEEVKNLNNKIDLLFSTYNENFGNLHRVIRDTLNKNLQDQEQEEFSNNRSFDGSLVRKRSASSPSHQYSVEPGENGSDDHPILYKLAKPLTSVRQIWEEYEYGINGQPSIKSLDLHYKNRWRLKGENTTYLRRRKVFLAIESCINRGLSEDAAIEVLENLRVDETGVKKTMLWLFDNIPDGFPEGYINVTTQQPPVAVVSQTQEAQEIPPPHIPASTEAPPSAEAPPIT